jgi:hypothetical protein
VVGIWRIPGRLGRALRVIALGGRDVPYGPPVDTSLPHAPDLLSFSRTVGHVQAYVRSEPGAYAALLATAQTDPAGTTSSLLALGAVLLDIAAGAFSLSPDEMLAKVSAGISGHASASA